MSSQISERRKQPQSVAVLRGKKSSGQSINRPVSLVPQKTKHDDPIGTAKVTVPALTVRSGAGLNYARVGGLTQGKSAEVYEEKKSWLRIKYNSGTGWIAKQYTDYKGKEPVTNPDEPEKPEVAFKITMTDSDVNVRSGPGTGYSILGKANTGEVYDAYEEKNGWYHISYNGKDAWISSDYAVKKGEEKPEKTVIYQIRMTDDDVNVRSGPGTGYGIVGKANTGQVYDVYEEKDGWYHINYNGQDAWVISDYAEKKE